jgi:hypothetical protein
MAAGWLAGWLAAALVLFPIYLGCCLLFQPSGAEIEIEEEIIIIKWRGKKGRTVGYSPDTNCYHDTIDVLFFFFFEPTLNNRLLSLFRHLFYYPIHGTPPQYVCRGGGGGGVLVPPATISDLTMNLYLL